MSETITKNIDWAHKLPRHWDVIRIKYIADPNQSNSFMDGDWIESPYITDEGIRYLTSGNIGDGIYKEQGSGHISEDTFVELNCKYAYPGDLVFSRLNAPFGRACILPSVEDRYVLAVDNVIVRTRKEYDKHFVCYVSQCDEFHMKASELAKGTAMRRISRTQLGDMSIPMPPLPEQQSIVRHLDAKCSAIDEAIERHKKIIEKLEEYKLSAITRLTTKGIEHVRYNDSEVDIIGTIPSNWSLKRLKYICDITTGDSDTQDRNPDGAYPFYVRSPIVERSNHVTFEGESILMAGDGAGAGRIFHLATGKYAVHQRVYRLYNIRDIQPKLLMAFLSCKFPDRMDQGSAMSTVPSVRLPMLKDFVIPIPPVEEQPILVKTIESVQERISEAVERHERLIEKLEEYRKSIIYNAVTGKIDCREATK